MSYFKHIFIPLNKNNNLKVKHNNLLVIRNVKSRGFTDKKVIIPCFNSICMATSVYKFYSFPGPIEAVCKLNTTHEFIMIL